MRDLETGGKDAAITRGQRCPRDEQRSILTGSEVSQIIRRCFAEGVSVIPGLFPCGWNVIISSRLDTRPLPDRHMKHYKCSLLTSTRRASINSLLK